MKNAILISVALFVSVFAVHAVPLFAEVSGKTVKVENEICPVNEGHVAKKGKLTYEYNGKKYELCCEYCLAKFKADPEKYSSRIKEFTLEAYQFGYDPGTITVKKGDIVILKATSRDTAHGVQIKAYGINETVEKGQIKRIEFIADKEGEFDIKCSVFCGIGHAGMKGKLIVEGK